MTRLQAKIWIYWIYWIYFRPKTVYNSAISPAVAARAFLACHGSSLCPAISKGQAAARRLAHNREPHLHMHTMTMVPVHLASAIAKRSGKEPRRSKVAPVIKQEPSPDEAPSSTCADMSSV